LTFQTLLQALPKAKRMKKNYPSEITNPQSLRSLMVDDSESDVLLIIRELKKGGYNPYYERVETAAAMKKSLQEKQWDVILCDYKMPKFDASSAIALLKETNIDVPLIIISGTVGEETAVECMRLGAQDYIIKGNLFRLCPVIARELEESEVRNKQKQAESQRKAVLEELHKSEEKYRTIIENIHEGYFEIDLAGNFTFFNDSMCRCLGYSPKELMDMNYKKYTDKENAKKLFKTYNETYKTGTTSRLLEYEIIRKDGTRRQLEGFVSLQKDSSGNPLAFRGTIRDITEHRKAEKTLKESEERYRALFDRSMDIIYIIDFDGNFIDANTNALNRFGYTREELPSLNVASLMNKDQLPFALKIIQEIKKYGVQRDLLEIRLRHKDGTPIYIESKGSAVISNGKAIAIQSIARDITERKAVEKKLLESEKYFKEITENSSDIIFITDKNGNIKYCSRSIERFSGYTPEELIGKSGFILIHPDDLERAVNDYRAAILLRDTAIPNGFRIIHKDGSERYLEGLGKNLLDNPDVAGFIMNVHDATESKRAEKKLLQTLDNLRKAFGVTMQVMVSAVEMIDPYTAGHQIRAADLARAIATEMGLSQEQIDGTRIASTIHDIGKLSIPAEILSKSTKLTEIEFSLVKEHSHSGYEMLKDVESPWPLAELIHQHHERMNGTGYPKNLKGDEIIIEARILAVADVVEAMASHRPYRASLGIEAAVEEIEKNKGILYDDTVADACLRLFREKKYQLQ
jgi:PAS domain S-box-containing protein